ncbi:Acylphosphatase [Candidatus Methanoperedenaceae archaeon GB50]|nr:MAG: Acylphosphatase [Candidatus Methanoperedenaceae archaeon GB50]CAD7777293.1 Acylphosphatase [Candidatus Methanoperedenaceae archaeon GB50]
MKRLTLTVSGDVQRAGYRDRVIELGRNLGLSGYASNLADGRVRVVAEGKEEKLELLREYADIRNALINVERIESSFSEATGEFSGFFKLVSEGETDERLDTAADLLKELIDTTKDGFKSLNTTMRAGFNRLAEGQEKMLEKQDSMLEKQDSMLEKQDSMLEKQDSLIRLTEEGFSGVKSEMKTGFSEVKQEMGRGFAEVKQEMKTGFMEVKEEIHLLRDDFRELFMQEVKDLRSEIAEIKATLARMQT